MKKKEETLKEEASMLYDMLKSLNINDESKKNLIYMLLQEVDKRGFNRAKFIVKKGKANEKV